MIIKSILLHFASLFIIATTFCFGQSGTISMEFIGNCGLHLSDSTTHIYIDFPYKSGAFNYMEFDEAKLDSIEENSFFLFTHKHADHFSRKNLRRVRKEKKGEKFGVWNISEFKQLEQAIDDFTIETFKTKHSFFGIPFRHYSYLITWHGKRIYLSGDTTEPETIGSISNIDWAFVPYWLLNNASKQEIKIDAKMFYVYHLYPQETQAAIEAFTEKEQIHPLTIPGEMHTLNY